MAKITKHGGASDAVTGEGLPRRASAGTAAEMLRARGKLGPYPQAETPEEPSEEAPETEGTGEVSEEETAEVEGDGPEEAPETEHAEPPRNASRDTWAEYVAARYGVEVPEETTRAELIELYGT